MSFLRQIEVLRDFFVLSEGGNSSPHRNRLGKRKILWHFVVLSSIERINLLLHLENDSIKTIKIGGKGQATNRVA
jgi:hypothetical protein